MKNKIVFIPGWMDTVENLVDWPGLDIWKKKFDVKKKIDADYIVGYSVGSNWALLNWEKNRNAKLILVMPLIPKRKVISWFFRWIRHEIFEGSRVSKKRMSCFPYFISGIYQLIKLLRANVMTIIDKVPKDNVVIIGGKEDHYFFDKDAAKMIRKKGFELIELDEVGHNWNEKIVLEINKIVNV
jgi:hypothetical protein